MKLKLSRIILWPKNGDLQPRVVEFNQSGISVITGGSQRGKSALIPIVDYCMGSDKCAIPVGEIRKTTAWFGVVLLVPGSQILLGRRNPEEQASTDDMYMVQEREIRVPTTTPERNCSVPAVVSRLNELAGMPSLSVGDNESAMGMGRPSIRDMAAFEFQPQHIIANPYTLFFKADTMQHQQKLREIFPLVLGAVTSEIMAKRARLKDVERALDERRTHLDTLKRGAEIWMGTLRGMYVKAKEYGLLTAAPETPDDSWEVPVYVGYLKDVPKNPGELGIAQIEPGATRRVSRQIAALRVEEESLTRAIGDKRRKLARVSTLDTTTRNYHSALVVQRERLQPTHWLSGKIVDVKTCPLCGSDSESALKAVRQLAQEVDRVESGLGATDAATTVLDREARNLQKAVEGDERQLNLVREQLAQLEGQSEALKTQRQTQREIDYYLGELHTQLASIEASDRGGALVEEIDRLEKEAAGLRSEINPAKIHAKESALLQMVSDRIGYYARILGVEHASRPANLDVRNLTVVVGENTARKDYLWEIGSGANWMGYHIATLLALHEMFLENVKSVVPQFIIFDQPSQAFFPGGYPRDNVSGGNGSAFKSEDIERVRNVFTALTHAIKRTKGALQIIVLEHADEETWRELPGIHLKGRWRGDEYLIPPEWINA